MVFPVTHRTSDTGASPGPPDYTTAAFTPTANSLLICSVAIEHDGAGDSRSTGAETITVSGGGLTWTKRTGEIYIAGDWGGAHALWTAPVGGSPSSMTLTIDIGNFGDDEYYPGWVVVDVTGHDVGDPFSPETPDAEAAVKTGGDSESHLHTLSSPPDSGNLVLIFFHAQNDVSGVFAVPSGFTSVNNLSGTSVHSLVAKHESTTDDEITSSDLGQTVWWVFSSGMEIAPAAAVDVYPPFPRKQTRSVRM